MRWFIRSKQGYLKGPGTHPYNYDPNPNNAWQWKDEVGLRANTTFVGYPGHEVVSHTIEELDMFRIHEE